MPAQNFILQKYVVCPASLVTLTGRETLIWAINFGYLACVLSVDLIVATFSALPNLVETFPLVDDVDAPEVSQHLHPSDSLLSKMIDAQFSDDQQLEGALEGNSYLLCSFDVQKHNMSKALHIRHSVNTEGHPAIHQMPYQVSS